MVSRNVTCEESAGKGQASGERIGVVPTLILTKTDIFRTSIHRGRSRGHDRRWRITLNNDIMIVAVTRQWNGNEIGASRA